MKKLMFAAAVAALGAMSANAGFTGNVYAYFAEGTSEAAAKGYTDYYLATAANYNSWWNGGNHGAIDSLNKIKSGTLAFNGLRGEASFSLSEDQSSAIVGPLSEGFMKTLNQAASYVVIYNPTSGDAFGIANKGDIYSVQVSGFPVEKPIATGQLTYNNQSSPYSAPIPEPTTGVLMLLGMAGLALKRKRA